MNQRRAAPSSFTAPVSQRQYQAMMEKRRQEENAVSDLSRYHKQNALIKGSNRSDDRVDSVRRQKRLEQTQAEIAQEMAMEQMLRDKEARQLLQEQERRLVDAMAKMNSEQKSKQLGARRVCEQSDELKELRAMLDAARVNKERATQVAQMELSRKQDSQADKVYALQMETDRLRAREEEEANHSRQQENKVEVRRRLQGQMAEREMAKLQEVEESRRERERIDAVVREIDEGDRRKMMEEKKRQQALQGDILKYLDQRREWRLQEAERTQEELRRIQEYQRVQETRRADLMQKKKAVRSDPCFFLSFFLFLSSLAFFSP